MKPEETGRADTILWPLLESLVRQARRICLWGAGFAVVGGLAGALRFHTAYTATEQMVRYNSPAADELFRQREAAPQTFGQMLRSTELIRLVSDRTLPPLTPGYIAANVRVTPEFNSDIITITATAATAEQAAALAHLFGETGMTFTQRIQADAAAEVVTFLQSQLSEVDARLRDLRRQSLSLPPSGGTSSPAGSLRSGPLVSRWQAAQDELVDLLGTFTEAHPRVQAQRAKIAVLEKELRDHNLMPASDANGSQDIATVLAASPSADPEVMRGQLAALETGRVQLAGRLNAAKQFRVNPPGYLRPFARANASDAVPQSPRARIGALVFLGGFAGAAFAAGLVLLGEFNDRRLRTTEDVARVTHLPVLASLGDLDRMTPAEKDRWAFRTWTALQSRLSRSPNHGLVCGVTSSSTGEGRSAWIKLLAQAANQCGFRVLTIATRAELETEIEVTAGTDSQALSANVLSTPTAVAEQLANPDAQPLVHIPLPGWVWSLERRKQWQSALSVWSHLENVVILVELAPAERPETVLLAENLPNLIWLTGSGQADAGSTRELLATLRHARCDLVGAVLNRAPGSVMDDIGTRWLEPRGGTI